MMDGEARVGMVLDIPGKGIQFVMGILNGIPHTIYGFPMTQDEIAAAKILDAPAVPEPIELQDGDIYWVWYDGDWGPAILDSNVWSFFTWGISVSRRNLVVVGPRWNPPPKPTGAPKP